MLRLLFLSFLFVCLIGCDSGGKHFVSISPDKSHLLAISYYVADKYSYMVIYSIDKKQGLKEKTIVPFFQAWGDVEIKWHENEKYVEAFNTGDDDQDYSWSYKYHYNTYESYFKGVRHVEFANPTVMNFKDDALIKKYYKMLGVEM